MSGRYIQDAYHGAFYAIARNLARRLTAVYDEALREYDLLVMPPTTYKADRYLCRRLPLKRGSRGPVAWSSTCVGSMWPDILQ